MYVCICNGVTEKEIRQVVAGGCETLAELTMRTGCGSSCGCCLEEAQRVLDEELHAKALRVPVLSEAA